ncbi:MAG: hypothetical protein HY905_14630 [Deltaproteobacteria bacterium]|nr:hypothetical protein [Deltaproteobacteria bacterium]
MTTPDPADELPAGDGAAPAAPSEPETEQGPSSDDPADGLLQDDELSVADRDLIEPGLDEADLARLELGEGSEDRPFPADDVGTPGGDEASAAAEEFDEGAGLVEGSEPADVPGATDDLFPADSGGEAVRDAGEEGIVDDFAESLDDSVHAGDVAWRQSGPPDEDDDLGGQLSARSAATGPQVSAAVRVTAIERPGPVHLLADLRGHRVVGDRPGVDAPGVQLALAAPAALAGPLGPPLRFSDEEQRVVAIGAARDPRSSAILALHAATDRAMIFRWSPGAADWVVADAFLARDGAPASWLRLGVSRVPFRLLSPAGAPSRVLAWRPGGPLLVADGAGPWTIREEGKALQALVEDEERGTILAFDAAEESGLLRAWGPGDRETHVELPAAVADVLLAPGAVVAVSAGTLWAACLDPELAAMRSEDGGRSWTAVPSLRAVRALALPPGSSRLFAVRRSSEDESDELWVVEPGGPARRAVRAADLVPGAGPPSPIAGLAAADSGAAWVLCGGRLFEIQPARSGVGSGACATGGSARSARRPSGRRWRDWYR